MGGEGEMTIDSEVLDEEGRFRKLAKDNEL
jgi:hypothetical protein